ncbi:GntR family transcriptional regulator [Microbacterium marinilacus]|uniref:GntR family transcriptional regulator n=1 Tax=Microbacterium marinilacus TaxID=415209 RepID=A0ABP7BKP4_9MICO|nr:GntR family transcriptional regulator [Microbacterium marinilacus]MBY0689730.1 GntR family transcriptional regulator [Microbacterium marinilacus]
MTSTNSLSVTWSDAQVSRVAAPLREQVIDALTRAILDNRLTGGQRLVERELMESLGVSRTTIREALRELASRGLITVVPQRGAVVSAPTREEAQDLYEVRAALESLIVERFVERATDDQVAALGEAVARFAEQVSRHEDVFDVLNAKGEFYTVLLDGAGSEVYRELVERLQTRVHVLRATSLSTEGRADETVEELNAIFAAVRRRDALAAASLCAAHIRAAAKTALAHLS